MTQLIKLAKVTSIPVTLDANTMYLLKDSNNKLSISLTDSTGANALGLGINYGDIAGTPTLATVSISGDYNDLLNKPSVILTSDKGSANGVADLDSNAKIPLSRIPDSVLGQLEYQGSRDMSVALPTASSANKGWYYIASNATAANGYIMGDWAVSNGTSWDKIDNTDAVQSVAGRTGAVTLTTADLTDFATAVTTPLGLKAPSASPTFTGTVTVPTMTAGDNSTAAASTAFVTNAVSTKAPSASPTFTGTVTVPTATAGDNSTKAASTAFVAASFAPLTNAVLVTPTVTGIKETKVAIAASAIDLAAGTFFSKTISTATTFTISNTAAAGVTSSFILDLTNGGAAVITWWTGLKWVAGTAPTLTTAGRDTLGFFTYDGGTTWSGFVIGKDVR